MANYDGSVRINTNLNTSNFDNGIKGMLGGLKSIASAVGVAFSVAALVKFGKECVELSSDLAEVDNVVDKSFGNLRGQMDALANESIKTLGMSRLTAYQTGSTFMAMGKSMLGSQQAAADMAIELTKLTGNMSSFYNKSQDLVSLALKSVYTGETETLKQYGIVMTEVNLQQFAYEQGINKKISAMTQAEKVQLRYNYVMQQTAFIGDDFLDTQDSWANQTRILKEQWKEFMTILGNGLVTVLTPVIHVLNNIVSALISFANTISSVMSKVFGIKGQQMSIAGANEDAAGSYEDAADAADEYAGATDKAGKAAKGAVANFDDVNVLQQNSGSGSGGGGASDAEQIDITETEAEESAIDQLSGAVARAKEIWDEFIDGFKTGFEFGADFLNLDEQVNNIKANCESIKESIRDILSDPSVNQSIDNFANQFGIMLGKITASVASIGLTIGENLTGGLAKYLDGNSDRIKKHLVKMFDIGAEISQVVGDFSIAFADIFSAFGDENGQEVTANIIGIFADAAMGIQEICASIERDVIELVFNPIIDNSSGLKTALDMLLGTISTFTGMVKQHIDTIIDTVVKFYDEHIKPIIDRITQGLSDLLEVFLDVWSANIQPAFDELMPVLSVLVETLDTLFSSLMTALGWLVDILGFLWTGIIVPFFSYLITIIGGAFSLAIKSITVMINGIVTVVKTIVGVVSGVINAVDKILVKFADNIKAGFKAVCYFIVDILNGIIGGVEWAINGIITLINTALDALYELASGIEGLLEHFGIGVNIPKLQLSNVSLTKIQYPALANGGITTGSTLAQIGEAGREAVLPLENNTEWMNDLADRLVSAMGGARGSATMEIDGKKFGQLMYPYMQGEASRIGTSMATS